jgi:hypothetical protein
MSSKEAATERGFLRESAECIDRVETVLRMIGTLPDLSRRLKM